MNVNVYYLGVKIWITDVNTHIGSVWKENNGCNNAIVFIQQ